MTLNPAKPKTPETRARIRAFRREDADRQLERCRIQLGMGAGFTTLDPSQPYRLVRALRMARRAASGGMRDYDPVRHLLLARYLKSLKLHEASHKIAVSKKNAEKQPTAREEVYDLNLVGDDPQP